MVGRACTVEAIRPGEPVSSWLPTGGRALLTWFAAKTLGCDVEGENISAMEWEKRCWRTPPGDGGRKDRDHRDIGRDEMKALVMVKGTGLDYKEFIEFLIARLPNSWCPGTSR